MRDLIPSQALRQLCEQRRQLIWSFCASFGVYLASVLVPNTLAQPGLDHDGLTAGMTLFVLFGAVAGAGHGLCRQPAGRRVSGREGARRHAGRRRLAYFWLTYALTGLARISGPHRPTHFTASASA